MAYTAPDALPTSLTAGTTWTWTRSFPDFLPSEGWTAKVRFVGDNDTLEATATTSGSDFVFAIPATTTASKTAGTYRVVEYVESGTERYVAATTVVAVAANPLTLAPGDQRTQDELDLAAARAALRDIVAGKAASWSIGTRSFTAHNLDELRKYIAVLARRVARGRTSRFDIPVAMVFRAPTGGEGAWDS